MNTNCQKPDETSAENLLLIIKYTIIILYDLEPGIIRFDVYTDHVMSEKLLIEKTERKV